MCTRFVYNGDDMITGFNFDIDLSVWDHKVVCEPDRFYIGIMRPDGLRHSYHGVNKNGNAGTLLYVHGCPAGEYDPDGVTVADLTERFIRAEITLDDALEIVSSHKLMYAPDATMQSMLSDRSGRVLILEPGIGYRLERSRYSLITNYSLLDPASTRPYIVDGDNRCETAAALLDGMDSSFGIDDAWSVLDAVKQEGIWATRVSFVYSAREGRVRYVENNRFDSVAAHEFAERRGDANIRR